MNKFNEIWDVKKPCTVGLKRGKTESITSRNRDVLNYMRAFFVANDQLPPCWKIAEKFGWVSSNAAQSHISKLEKFGLIVRNEVGNFKFPSEAV